MAETLKPADGLPEWASSGTITPKPSGAKKASGWTGAPEKPAHNFFNFWQNLVFLWTTWASEKIDKTVGNVLDTELTIVAGVILPTQGNHRVDTQADAAEDDLDTITPTNLDSGRLLLIRAEDAARTVKVKHGTGNIRLEDGKDADLDDADRRLLIQFDGTNWVEVARSFALSQAQRGAGAEPFQGVTARGRTLTTDGENTK